MVEKRRHLKFYKREVPLFIFHERFSDTSVYGHSFRLFPSDQLGTGLRRAFMTVHASEESDIFIATSSLPDIMRQWSFEFGSGCDDMYRWGE